MSFGGFDWLLAQGRGAGIPCRLPCDSRNENVRWSVFLLPQDAWSWPWGCPVAGRVCAGQSAPLTLLLMETEPRASPLPHVELQQRAVCSLPTPSSSPSRRRRSHGGALTGPAPCRSSWRWRGVCASGRARCCCCVATALPLGAAGASLNSEGPREP